MTSMSSTPPIIVRGMSRAGSRSSSPADRACPPIVVFGTAVRDDGPTNAKPVGATSTVTVPTPWSQCA